MLSFFKKANLPSEERAQISGQPLLPLRSILAVGAYENIEYGDTKDPDSRELTHAVNFLIEEGLIGKKADGQPDIVVNSMNLCNGQDFLQDPKPCDILMICYIPGFHRYQSPEYMAKMQENFSRASDRDFNISLNHNCADWRQAVLSANPKMISTYGGARELGTHHLENLRYDTAHPSPGSWEILRRRQHPFGLPDPFLGFMVRHDITDSIVANHDVKVATRLGEKLEVLKRKRDLVESGSILRRAYALFN